MGENGKRSRRARASAVATAVAVAAPILFLGGALARAAESSPDAPTSVSVTETDASGQPVGTGDPTTTSSSSANDPSAPVIGNRGNTGSTEGSVDQTLSVSILPGALTVTPSTESVSFTGRQGQTDGGPNSGSLSTITVVDARGSLVGWRATVSLESVNGVSASKLANAKLCISPDDPTVVAGNPPEVKSGRQACANAGRALVLFYAPPGGGGGTFTDSGALSLSLPGMGTGPVTATLAVAVH